MYFSWKPVDSYQLGNKCKETFFIYNFVEKVEIRSV